MYVVLLHVAHAVSSSLAVIIIIINLHSYSVVARSTFVQAIYVRNYKRPAYLWSVVYISYYMVHKN